MTRAINSTEQVDDITECYLFYKDENGLTQKIELDPKKVYTTRDYKYQSTMKFITMPGLRNGCVSGLYTSTDWKPHFFLIISVPGPSSLIYQKYIQNMTFISRDISTITRPFGDP